MEQWLIGLVGWEWSRWIIVSVGYGVFILIAYLFHKWEMHSMLSYWSKLSVDEIVEIWRKQHEARNKRSKEIDKEFWEAARDPNKALWVPGVPKRGSLTWGKKNKKKKLIKKVGKSPEIK